MVRYHNIFYYYRGAVLDDGRHRERQLENNTTKALINTLDHCDDRLAQSFLSWLGIPTQETAKFALQRKTIGEPKLRRVVPERRLLLGLTPDPSRDRAASSPEASAQGDSLPDAWIYGDSFVVLIESKTAGALDESQMVRHAETLRGEPNHEVRRKEKTWEEVHGFFSNMKQASNLSDRDEWLIGQFTEYLEWINMTGFTGFDREAFEHFVTQEDEDARAWVRDTMAAFADRIAGKLKSIDPFYESADVGRLELKQDHCWAAFGPSEKRYRNWAHQTIALGAEGIAVFVNVELKPAIDRLRKKLRGDREAMRLAISGISIDRPVSIEVQERVQRQASLHDSFVIARLEDRYLRDPRIGADTFTYLETVLDKVRLPYLSVRTEINRGEVLKLSQSEEGRDLVSGVLRIMQAFHPLVTLINEPDWSRRE